MIIPPDAGLNLQHCLKEIADRLDRLEGQTSGLITQDDIYNLKADLQAAIAAATAQASYINTNRVFRGGGAHALGYVPDPGLPGLLPEQVLQEDGKWVIPFNGLMPRVDIDTDFLGYNLLNLLASLVISGQLSAGDITCNRVNAFGDPRCMLSKSTDFTHNATGTWLQAPTDMVLEDNDYMADLPTGTINIKTGGLYRASFNVLWAFNATGSRGIAIGRNGVYPGTANPIMFVFGPAAATAGGGTGQSGSRLVRMKDNELVTLSAFQDSGGNLALTTQSGTTHSFSMERIGP